MKRILLLLFVFLFANTLVLYAQSSFSSPLIGVGVVTTNLEKSLDFYTNGIGMVKTGSFTVESEKAKELGLTNGITLLVTVLKLEDSKEANEWKIMSFDKKPRKMKKKFINENVGMQYITIQVKALKPIIDRLKQMNIEFLGNTPAPLSNNRFLLMVQDPDGVFIELIGPME